MLVALKADMQENLSSGYTKRKHRSTRAFQQRKKKIAIGHTVTLQHQPDVYSVPQEYF